MNDRHWEILLRIIDGEIMNEKPVGFIIDSPWLPHWHGLKILNYFTDPEAWFDANLIAHKTFPEVMFFPGFWVEYGMCTEPSAFGTKLVWTEDDFPHPEKLQCAAEAVASLHKPNVRTDGLLPFVISRMQKYEDKLKGNGYRYRFASSPGPFEYRFLPLRNDRFHACPGYHSRRGTKGSDGYYRFYNRLVVAT